MDSKAFGCVWKNEEDCFCVVNSLKPLNKYTRRAMLNQLGKSFERLVIFFRFLLRLGLFCKNWQLIKVQNTDRSSLFFSPAFP